MTKGFAAVAGLLLLGSTSALAGSGATVQVIKSNDPVAPNCVQFKTQNDAAWYGISLNDPGADQMLITLNNARGMVGGPTFLTTAPGGGFYPGDCPLPIIYVHTLAR